MTGFDRMCLHSNSYLKHINSNYQNTTLPTSALFPHKPPATHRRFALSQHSALTAFIPDVQLENLKRHCCMQGNSNKKTQDKTQAWQPKDHPPHSPPFGRQTTSHPPAVCPVPGLSHSVSYDVTPLKFFASTQSWRRTFKQNSWGHTFLNSGIPTKEFCSREVLHLCFCNLSFCCCKSQTLC